MFSSLSFKNCRVRGASFLAFMVMLFGLIAPVQATLVTFAAFDPATGGSNLRFVSASGGGGSFFSLDSAGGGSAISPGLSQVQFNLLADGVNSPLSVQASMFFSASTTSPAATFGSGSILQSDIAGSFEYRYTGSTSFMFNNATYSNGALLLRGVYTDADFTARQNSTSGLMFGSSEGDLEGTMIYSSDVFGFGDGGQDFSFAFTSASPAFANQSGSLGSFSATSSGTFSADIVSPPVSAAPEPVTWMMMLCGFGAIGVALRRNARPTLSGGLASPA